MECEITCEDGIRRVLDISAEATDPYGCVYQQRLRTPNGEGVALGVFAGKMYVLLESNMKALIATPFTLKDFRDGLVEILPDPQPGSFSSSSHRVKRVTFDGRNVSIVTQDRNGPCPVLAVANALALLGKIDILPDDSQRITASELCHTIIKYIVEGDEIEPPHFVCPAIRKTDDFDTVTLAGLVEGKLTEARAKWNDTCNGEKILARLYGGMNISPIFSALDGFDGEEDLLLFALAGLRVVHGWLINDNSFFAPLREMSFNEVSLLATNVNHKYAALASMFLQCTQSQLTEEGLDELRHELRDGEVVVLFWNNHFSTAVKLDDRFLQLLSDETYAYHSSVVFEAIEDVHGSTTFTDGNGKNPDAFLLEVQFRTGNEFSEDAIASARKEVRLRGDDQEPTPDAVVEYLHSVHHKEHRDGGVRAEADKEVWPSWVREGAAQIEAMGFGIGFKDACILMKKHKNLNAVIDELCGGPSI